MKTLIQYIQESSNVIHAGAFNVGKKEYTIIKNYYKKYDFANNIDKELIDLEVVTTGDGNDYYDAFWIYNSSKSLNMGILTYKNEVYVTKNIKSEHQLADFITKNYNAIVHNLEMELKMRHSNDEESDEYTVEDIKRALDTLINKLNK